MASLIKRAGKWCIKYRLADGSQKWVTGYTDKGQTRELANKLENEARAVKLDDVDYAADHGREQRRKSIDKLIEQYENHLAAAGRSTNHISYTIADVRKCFDFAGVDRPAQLTRAHIDAWVLSLAKDAPRTLNRRIGSVQAFLRHFHDEGTLPRYVLKKYPKRNVKGTERRKYRHLQPAEVTKLLKRCPDAERRDIYKFALLTGLRFSEIGSMKPGNFDFDALQVTVSAADAKNKRKDQRIPMHPDLVKLLGARCKGKSAEARIFELPPRTDAAKLIRADCEAAKVNPDRVTFHSLRHTFVTRLAENNVHPTITQELARHSQLETTMSFYTHFERKDKVSALAMLKAG